MRWLRQSARTTRLSSSITLCGTAPAKVAGGRVSNPANHILSALRHQNRRTGPGEPLFDLLARACRPVEAAEDVRPRQAMELVQFGEQRDQGVVVSRVRHPDVDGRRPHAASTSRSAEAAKPKAS